MTVTTATISTVSRGRITIADEDLTYYHAIALEVLTLEDPGFGPAVYDRALALLICHYYAGDEQGDLETKSEDRGGDWKFSKDPGTTTYLIQYRTLLATYAAVADAPDAGVVRGDATIEGLALDQNDLPTFTDDEGALL